jgi:hypothetical protein
VGIIPTSKDNNKKLMLSFNMGPTVAYGGYWTQLLQRDLSDYSSLRFALRTESPVPPIYVGIKNAQGVEAKTLVAPYASTQDANSWREVSIPLSALKGPTDFSTPDALFFAFSNKDKSGKGTVWIDDIRFERTPCKKVADFDSPFEWNLLGDVYSTHQNGAAAISVSFMPDTAIGQKTTNTACRISYGGTIGHDYGPQGGFSYCSWQCGLNGIDANGFKYLMLRIRGEKGGETPNIYLNDSVKRVPMRAKEMPKIKKEWQTIKLPLQHYADQGIDISHLDALVIVFEWEEQSSTIYIDDIQFE